MMILTFYGADFKGQVGWRLDREMDLGWASRILHVSNGYTLLQAPEGYHPSKMDMRFYQSFILFYSGRIIHLFLDN